MDFSSDVLWCSFCPGGRNGVKIAPFAATGAITRSLRDAGAAASRRSRLLRCCCCLQIGMAGR